jgi:hypothetical protein
MNWLDSSSFEKESSYKIGRNELDFLLVRPRTREVLINGYFGMVMRIGFEKGSKGVLLSGICPVGAKPMSYSADGRQLVIQSPKENELQVIDADSGKLKLLLASKDASPRLATFNKSGNLLAVVWGEAQLHSGGKDVLQVHDLATGDVVMKAERFDSNFTKVYFADNDQRIILTTFNELRVIDANNGRQMLQLDLSPCWGEVMSTDGKQLLRVGTGVGEMPRASEELFWGRL